MTPLEFVEAIRELHEPYLPRLVSVLHTDPCHPDYNGGEFHEPTVEEQIAAQEWWCDGCRTPASRCLVAHLLVLVEP